MILGRENPINMICWLAETPAGVGHGRTLRVVGVAEPRTRLVRSKLIVNISMTGETGKGHAGGMDSRSISYGVMKNTGVQAAPDFDNLYIVVVGARR
jgi:hypothetical protein